MIKSMPYLSKSQAKSVRPTTSPISVKSLVAQRVKRLPATQVDLGSIPGSGRSSGEGNGAPLQYLCPENPMGGGAG